MSTHCKGRHGNTDACMYKEVTTDDNITKEPT